METQQINKDALIYLMKQHRGRGNAISADRMAERLHITNVEARELYSQAVKDGSALLGSHPEYGFFQIEDEVDYKLSLRQIESRIKALAERKRALEKLWEEKEQLSFEDASSRIRLMKEALEGAMCK